MAENAHELAGSRIRNVRRRTGKMVARFMLLRPLPMTTVISGDEQSCALIAADPDAGLVRFAERQDVPAAGRMLSLRSDDDGLGPVRLICRIVSPVTVPNDRHPGPTALVEWLQITALSHCRYLDNMLKLLGVVVHTGEDCAELPPDVELVYDAHTQQVMTVKLGTRERMATEELTIAPLPVAKQNKRILVETHRRRTPFPMPRPSNPVSNPAPQTDAVFAAKPKRQRDKVAVDLTHRKPTPPRRAHTPPLHNPWAADGLSHLPEFERPSIGGRWVYEDVARPMVCDRVGQRSLSFLATGRMPFVDTAVRVSLAAEPVSSEILWLRGTVSRIEKDEATGCQRVTVLLLRTHVPPRYRQVVQHFASRNRR